MFWLVAALVALQVAVEQIFRGRPPRFERNLAVVAKMLDDLGGIDEVPGKSKQCSLLAKDTAVLREGT